MYKGSAPKIFDYALRLRGGIAALVILATLQLDDQSGQFLDVDGGDTDREVRMPASNLDGVFYRVANVGQTNTLTLKDSAGVDVSGPTPTLQPGENAWVYNEGGTWKIAAVESNSGDSGTFAAARILLATTPTANDTITMGANVYEWQPNGGAVTDDAFIAVEIDGIVNSQANLVAAVNATYNPDEHPNITNVATTAPALANGTENLFGEAQGPGQGVSIRSAVAPGGAEVSANPDVLLAENLTAAADVWDVGDVNLNTLGHLPAANRRHSRIGFTVTAAMITEGIRVLIFPFFVSKSGLTVQVWGGDDPFARVAGTDTVLAPGQQLVAIVFGGGIAPDIQAGDVLILDAWE